MKTRMNNERDQAMLQAMKLSNQYNIDLNEARSFNEPGVIKVEELKVTEIRLEPWLRAIIGASCKLFFCTYYQSHYGYGKIPAFVGTKENIDSALDMATYLMDSIKKEAKRLYKGDQEYQKSFKLGASHSVYKKACEMTDPKSVESTGTALMVVKTALERANEDYTETLGLTPSRQRSSQINRHVYNSGRTFGNNISLNKQIKEVKRVEVKK